MQEAAEADAAVDRQYGYQDHQVRHVVIAVHQDRDQRLKPANHSEYGHINCLAR